MSPYTEPQPADQSWELDQEALKRVLHDLDRVRQAYIQDYAVLRADRLDHAATAAEIDKFLRIGGNVWDGNYMALAALLKHRASLTCAPKPTVSAAEIPVTKAAGEYEISGDPLGAMRAVIAEWLTEQGIEVIR